MTERDQHLKQLTDIKEMMERSSRFISLSGLSGVFAGLSALIGATAAYVYLDYEFTYGSLIGRIVDSDFGYNHEPLIVLAGIAMVILISAILSGIFFTARKAKKDNLPIWTQTTVRVLTNLFLPVATGGALCFILLLQGAIHYIAPMTLVFYGLGLVSASKYTFDDVRWLGISEIILGLTAMFFIGNGLWFWVIGFGFLHIIYGGMMYFKYER